MSVAKAVVQLLMAILAAVLPVLTSGPLDATAWVNVVILGCGAIAVWNSANIPGWAWAKFVASAVSAGAVVLATALTSGHALDMTDYIQIGMAILAALAVGAVPNSPRVTAV